jgi:hypothetical protein
MAYQERPDNGEYAEFYGKYVGLVPDGDIVAILVTQIDDTVALLRDVSELQADGAYAPGKWSVKEVIGHIADAERVFMYRALTFARSDDAVLPGFDENAWAPEGRFNRRPLASLVAELVAVRRASVALLAGLPASAWTRGGTASGAQVSVRGLAWIAAGHELHHRHILATRYLHAPLIQPEGQP